MHQPAPGTESGNRVTPLPPPPPLLSTRSADKNTAAKTQSAFKFVIVAAVARNAERAGEMAGRVPPRAGVRGRGDLHPGVGDSGALTAFAPRCTPQVSCREEDPPVDNYRARTAGRLWTGAGRQTAEQ